MRFAHGVLCEQVGDGWLVLAPGERVHNVSGAAAQVIDCVVHNRPVPDKLDDAVAALVDLLNARPELSRATLGATPREWDAADTLKNILVMLQHPDGTCEPLAVGIGGDRELDLRRLEAQVSPAVPTVFGDEDFDRYRALIKGYIGPGALGLNSATGIRYLVDPRVVDGSVWVSGADQPGRHTVGLVAGRDFVADGTIEAAEVRDGDQCPSCTGELVLDRGIEIGHIFQLGRKYSEALGLSVTGPDGEPIVVTMGSYGIGVSRAVAAIAESHHDDAGLCWPAEIAPADIHLLIAGKQGGPQHDIAQRLATDLESAGLRVLFDDRADVSVGVKFADAELIGIPTIVVVGRGVTADPAVLEVRDRRTGERRDVVLTDAVAELSAGLR
jgi:prolyl-tRNA synthetase